MSETIDCEERAREYMTLAEAETDQSLKALLLSMGRNWTLLGEIERIRTAGFVQMRRDAVPRMAPGVFTTWAFAILVRVEARGGWSAPVCRRFRETLYDRLRRGVRSDDRASGAGSC